MTATLSRIEPDVFAALKSGDEKAFEQVFRVSYYPLVDEVLPLVKGDGYAAARAAETVFVQAWKARGELESPEMLEEGLHGGIRETAVRAESRHIMAHRLDELEGGHTRKDVVRPAPGVDEAWSMVRNALHPDRVHIAEEMHKAARHARHEAAEQLEEMAQPKLRWPLFVTAFVMIVVLGTVAYLVTRTTDVDRLVSGLAAPNVSTPSASPGELTAVTLPDGSKARLGPNSRLRVPAQFGGSMRGLEVIGTASFVVAPLGKPRFLVRAGTALLMATGTEFTVRAYPDERDVTILVQSGTVIATVSDSTRELVRGNALAVAKNGSMRVPNAAELEESVGWTNGSFVIAGRPLRAALAEIKRWYGADIFVRDTSLLDRVVTVRGAADSYESTLVALEKSGNLKRAWEGTNLVLRPAGASARRPASSR